MLCNTPTATDRKRVVNSGHPPVNSGHLAGHQVLIENVQQSAAVLTAKDRIAATTYRITLAHARYSL